MNGTATEFATESHNYSTRSACVGMHKPAWATEGLPLSCQRVASNLPVVISVESVRHSADML